MSNLALRILTAVVALPLVGLLIQWEVRLGFALLVFLVAGLALAEYMAIVIPQASAGQRATLVATGVALCAGTYFRPDLALAWVLAALMISAAIVLLGPGEITGAAARLGGAGFGVFYIGLLAAPLALLQRDATPGHLWVFLAIAVTFGNDTGAYFAGKALGRHKLYPLISPSKTVEGAAGGMAAGLAITVLAKMTFFAELTWRDVVLVGVPAGFLGPVGDLVESMLKRSAGVKDSGRMVPGHGGMFDRVDALLFVGAWIYGYVAWLR
jgi:phosphatidate cytidylyltransferase